MKNPGRIFRNAARAGWILVLLPAVAPLSGQVRMTKDEALHQYFADARVERRTAFLTPGQVEDVQTRAHARVDARVVTYYVARGAEGVMGTAFFETQTVRTMPATIMTVINPDSTVRAVEILAFHEPEDYMPPDRWLAQFEGKAREDDLFLKRGIRNIAGATMTSRVLSDAVRRILITYERVIAPSMGER